MEGITQVDRFVFVLLYTSIGGRAPGEAKHAHRGHLGGRHHHQGPVQRGEAPPLRRLRGHRQPVHPLLGWCVGKKACAPDDPSNPYRHRCMQLKSSALNSPHGTHTEPTSGLDSFAALKVMEMMAKFCGEGRLIVCTIHQPRSQARWAPLLCMQSVYCTYACSRRHFLLI